MHLSGRETSLVFVNEYSHFPGASKVVDGVPLITRITSPLLLSTAYFDLLALTKTQRPPALAFPVSPAYSLSLLDCKEFGDGTICNVSCTASGALEL